MCNRYANTIPQDTMRSMFGANPADDQLGNAPPQFAIFPRYDAPVVRLSDAGRRELVWMHWGFVLPQTSRKTGQPIQPKAVNNARDDRIRTAPMWRTAFESRRCLVPASSYSEAKGRQPADHHWFGVDGGQPFAFAGIWSRYRGPYKTDEVDMETYTIVTTGPNTLTAAIQPDRMPAILGRDSFETWLTGPPESAAGLIGPFPYDRMEILGHGSDMIAEPEG